VHTINLIKVLSLVSDPLTNIIIIVLEILKDVFVFYSPNITRITQFCGGHKASLNLQRKYGICCGQTPTQMKRLNFFLLKYYLRRDFVHFLQIVFYENICGGKKPPQM